MPEICRLLRLPEFPVFGPSPYIEAEWGGESSNNLLIVHTVW